MSVQYTQSMNLHVKKLSFKTKQNQKTTKKKVLPIKIWNFILRKQSVSGDLVPYLSITQTEFNFKIYSPQSLN